MALIRGARLGAYEVIAQIGVGGMGEVYRARDTQLGRDVALKVLPELFVSDAERVARFQREAKTLASLNHPNIGAIHGLERSNGVTALVLELVEGPTLADRIADGPIPLDESLPIARQIAEALEAAHEQGVVHRDLKPANIKLRPDGTVKVLDFGLAKARAADSAIAPAGDSSRSPTLTTPAATRLGVIMGTAAYMSPEQARGKPIDKRTDIWAFGCVLYEMLTGRRPFAGDEVSDVLASVLAREPDMSALPAAVPPSIRRLLRRCLQKERNDRLRDIGDARIEIREALSSVEHEASVPEANRRGRTRLAVVSMLASIALAAALAFVWLSRPTMTAPEVRLNISTPPTTVPASVAISPDGKSIAYVATADSQSRLWLRPLNSTAARPLAGTDRASYPFWSPDSQSLGFFADNRLKRVDIDGGSVRVITNAHRGTGGAWNRDGLIVFSSLGLPMSKVSDRGGDAVEVPGVFQLGSDFSPQFLPDGHRFLYFVRAGPDSRGVYIGSVDEALAPRRLLDSDTGGVYISSGHVLFIRQRTLFAQRFNADRLELIGTPFAVAQDAATCSCISASQAGAITYRTAGPPLRQQFVWFDRSGKELGVVGESGMSNPSLSPDGGRVVGYRGVEGNIDVWLLDTKRGVLTRVTSDAGDDVSPAWSPDGDRIVFSSNRKGAHDLYVKSVSGGRNEELLLATPQQKSVNDWSPDGRFVLFETYDRKRTSDLWALPMLGDRKPFLVVGTDFEEVRGQFSPDGNWVAYQSDESGRDEIYVQPFPGPGNKWPISTNGGSQVRWRRDGKEIYYVALDGRLMAAPIALRPNGQAPDVGAPVALFAPPLGGMVQQGDFRHQYMVSADGQRFLVATLTERENPPITVILNWKPQP